MRIGHTGGTADIAGLLFDDKEVREVVSAVGKPNEPAKIHDPELIDLTAARRRLRVTKSTIDEIVRLQLIPSVSVSGQAGRKTSRTMISTADLDAFDAEHVQLDEIAIIQRRDSHDIRRQLAVAGVRPLLGGQRQIARFYRKVDVEPLGLI
ncbi:hypothetical protein ACVIRO_005850 [Rhizobium ruizarguesonis]